MHRGPLSKYIRPMNIIKIIFVLGLTFKLFAQEIENTTEGSSAQDSLADTLVNNSAPADTSNIVQNKNTNFDDVDILADNELRSYFLFVDNFNESDESIREIIEERDLARDEFLMQNIDREEFEQERILLIFKNKEDKDSRRTYGVLKVTEEDFKPAAIEVQPSSQPGTPQ